MVRGATEMAKKMSFKDNSGIDMSLPLTVNLHSVTLSISVFPSISPQNVLAICFSSLVLEPPRCLNWLNTGWGSLSMCRQGPQHSMSVLWEPAGFRVGPGWMPPFQSLSQRRCSVRHQQAPVQKLQPSHSLPLLQSQLLIWQGLD